MQPKPCDNWNPALCACDHCETPCCSNCGWQKHEHESGFLLEHGSKMIQGHIAALRHRALKLKDEALIEFVIRERYWLSSEYKQLQVSGKVPPGDFNHYPEDKNLRKQLEEFKSIIEWREKAPAG